LIISGLFYRKFEKNISGLFYRKFLLIISGLFYRKFTGNIWFILPEICADYFWFIACHTLDFLHMHTNCKYVSDIKFFYNQGKNKAKFLLKQMQK